MVRRSPKTLLGPLLSLHDHQTFFDVLQQHGYAEIAGGGNVFSKAFIISTLEQKTKRKKLVWIAPTKQDTFDVCHSLHTYSELPCTIFAIEEKVADTQMRLVEFLQFLSNDTPGIAVVTPEFLWLRVPRIEDMEEEILLLQHGQEISPYALFEQLIQRGFHASEDRSLVQGQYRSTGDTVTVFPIGTRAPVRITFLGNTIEDIYTVDQETGRIASPLKELRLFPMLFTKNYTIAATHIPESCIIVNDEVEFTDLETAEGTIPVEKEMHALMQTNTYVHFTAFPETDTFLHLRYLSVLKYYNLADFTNDLKERFIAGWRVVLLTKQPEAVTNALEAHEIPLVQTFDQFLEQGKKKGALIVLPTPEEERSFPHSYQNAEQKVLVLTDKEIFLGKKKKKVTKEANSMLAFLSSLKKGDYIVHADHGVGVFAGIEQKSIDEITKEYLEIRYADNDKLFIPTDQSDKITKYISNQEKPPKLTRLDSAEWTTLTKKVKTEANKIAKELLALYAKRAMAQGFKYVHDTEEQEKFEATFPYEETPGQIKAINDVKADMEKEQPMDRLVCGDVGFGKTEVAMRATFKAVQSKKQVAVISPITILADQHFKSFQKRMKPFGVRVEMLSRFKSAKEQKDILKRLALGEVDVVVGTHRLLQTDIHFKDLGLIVVDEEQRFGVKQKEKLKEMRCNVDVLTLSATPIPRTLHMSLSNLRDITTITTPPPGRLPIITEVRKYSDHLVREAILRELERGGQIYFLHNKVRTIEGIAHKLRNLVPEARFIVSHGQLDPRELERRVLSFKKKEADVLISSTIIENGIDLPNANTLIVNSADQFGLSQLYQLRGRVGRGRTQAYTYLLYSSRTLPVDAKKRLRAIVEASELGSGFQIAMKDLEIRGAGDILGSSQHGVMNAVGVSHFIRLLNQTVDEMKTFGESGPDDATVSDKDVSVELPLTAYIPDWYIAEYEDKIATYQRFASLHSIQDLDEELENLEVEYGEMPAEVQNLIKVIRLKILARRAHIDAIRVFNQPFGLKEANLLMGKSMKPEFIFSLLESNQRWFIAGDKLKIKLEDLGVDWYAGLIQGIEALSTVPDKLRKK